MFKMTESKRSKLYTGFLGVAALALFAACADDTAPEEEPAEDPAMQEDPAQDPTEEDPMQDDPMEEDPGMEGTETEDVEGAGDSDATSTLGLFGSSVSWSL